VLDGASVLREDLSRSKQFGREPAIDKREPVSLTLESQLERTARLVGRHYPHWEIGEAPGKGTTPMQKAVSALESRENELPFLIPGSEGGQRPSMLEFAAAAPLAIMARKQSGLGRPDPDFPRTLWPMMYSMTTAFRLRMLGWLVDVSWPGGLSLDAGQLGEAICREFAGWMVVQLRIGLYPAPAHRRPRNAPPLSLAMVSPTGSGVEPLQAVPSLVQAIVDATEAPWKRDFLLRYYRKWCVTLRDGRTMQRADGGGLLYPRDVDPEGLLLCEDEGGAIHRISPPIHEVSE